MNTTDCFSIQPPFIHFTKLSIKGNQLEINVEKPLKFLGISLKKKYFLGILGIIAFLISDLLQLFFG